MSRLDFQARPRGRSCQIPQYTFVLALMIAVLCADLGRADFSYLKHKIRLKKLAKLAFVAKLLTPTIIPVPIPLPILKRSPKHHKLRGLHHQVIKLEDEPWNGGWHVGSTWEQLGGGGSGWPSQSGGEHGWSSQGGGGHGWPSQGGGDNGWLSQGGAGWNEGGSGGWQQSSFGPWDQRSLGAHLEKVEIREETVPYHEVQESTPQLHRAHIEQVQQDAGPWMNAGSQSNPSQYHEQGSHDVEVREEIIPALKGAGFLEGANGELTKVTVQETSRPHSDEWRNTAGWPSNSGKHTSNDASASQDWSKIPGPIQNAEILEAKEVGTAKIVDAPSFDVESANFGGFDVSDVPVQAMRAPPVKKLTEMDPWPSSVAAPHSSDHHQAHQAHHAVSSTQGYWQATHDSHHHPSVSHPHTDKSELHQERDSVQAEVSRSHQSGDAFAGMRAAHGHDFGPQSWQEFFSGPVQADRHRTEESSHLWAGIVRGVPNAELKPLSDIQTSHKQQLQQPHQEQQQQSTMILTPPDAWKPLVVDHASQSTQIEQTKDGDYEGQQEDAKEWADAHRRSRRR